MENNTPETMSKFKQQNIKTKKQIQKGLNSIIKTIETEEKNKKESFQETDIKICLQKANEKSKKKKKKKTEKICLKKTN